MRKERQHIADEFGATAGILTIEDLVETLVGRIEAEPSLGGSPPIQIAKSEDSMMVDGLTRLSEFEESINLDDIDADSDAVGGLVMELLGRVPKVGETAVIGGKKILVHQMEGHRVASVKLTHADVIPASESQQNS